MLHDGVKNAKFVTHIKKDQTQSERQYNKSRFMGQCKELACDIVGPLPETEKGNLYLLVVTDYFTKWSEAYAVPDHTAQTVADTLVTQWICRYGTMLQLHTDQGRDFESNLFQGSL